MIRTKAFLKIYFCNYYKTLNVEQDAQINEIKQRFLQLAKKHHPDTAEVQSEQFSKIKTAYDTLRDPELRKQYDYELIHGNPHSRQKSHFYYNQPQYDGAHQMKIQALNSFFKFGLLVLTGYMLSQYFTPMTEHEIRRQNIILSNENIDSSPGVQEKRRKMLMKQMQQKKISSRVIQIKCSNSAIETTKAKNTRKNSIESIPGVKKQKTLVPYVPKQQYM